MSAFSRPTSRAVRNAVIAVSATTLAGYCYHSIEHSSRKVFLESPPVEPATYGSNAKKGSGKSLPLAAEIQASQEHAVWVWGSNKFATLGDPIEYGNNVKSPRPLGWMPRGGALRDLVLFDKYGAAVDGKGDLWIWGAGFEGVDPVGVRGLHASLKGRNITALAPTATKLFALSAHSGKVYCVSTSKALQNHEPRGQSGERDPWYYFGVGGWFKQDPKCDFVELQVEDKLGSGEKFIQIVSGKNHILALTSKGRTFSLAANPSGNSHAQLGLRSVSPSPLDDAASSASSAILSALHPDLDIRYSTILQPIKSLSSIAVAQVAAGENTSFVLTAGSGRVLGWGQNTLGNIGLGATANVDIVPVPSEVVLGRIYPGRTGVTCVGISAGGNNTFFTVQRTSPNETSPLIDLLAVGSGISGTLGNGLWSSACGSPVRVKTVSGLQEYSEINNAFEPITIRQVSVSPNGSSTHAAVTLHTVKLSESSGVDAGLYGNDVMVWGSGGEYQLGNGKRSNMAVPQHLASLKVSLKGAGSKADGDAEKNAIELAGEQGTVDLKEARIGSGTRSPMPHSRLQLFSGYADALSLDPANQKLDNANSKVLKKKCKVEQTMHAGWNATAVYWKIVE